MLWWNFLCIFSYNTFPKGDFLSAKLSTVEVPETGFQKLPHPCVLVRNAPVRISQVSSALPNTYWHSINSFGWMNLSLTLLLWFLPFLTFANMRCKTYIFVLICICLISSGVECIPNNTLSVGMFTRSPVNYLLVSSLIFFGRYWHMVSSHWNQWE